VVAGRGGHNQSSRWQKLALIPEGMQIVIGRDGKTGQVLADAMDPVHQPALTALNRTLEGRTEKLKNPHPSGSLAWFSWIVALAPGWLHRRLGTSFRRYATPVAE
jgi:hypothetical protein